MSAITGRLATLLGLKLLPHWVGDALLAVLAAVTWVEPFRLGPTAPTDLMALYIFEGLFIHSTPFVIVARKGTIPKWFLLIYVPFAVAAAVFIESKWLLALFLWHIASVAWRDKITDDELNVQMVRYVVVIFVFLLAPAIAWLAPTPPLGWAEGIPTSAVMVRGSGEPVPGALPAICTLYYSLRAVWHIVWWHWERTGEVDRMKTSMRENEAAG